MARVNIKKNCTGIGMQNIFWSLIHETMYCRRKKKNRLPLDPVKMEQIRGILRRVCDKESDFDFNTIWQDIKKSIGVKIKE